MQFKINHETSKKLSLLYIILNGYENLNEYISESNW